MLASLALALYGLRVRQPLLVGFAPVGLFAGASQLYYWLRPPTSRMHWWFEHMGSMGGCTIAVVTAFLVINAPRLGLQRLRAGRVAHARAGGHRGLPALGPGVPPPLRGRCRDAAPARGGPYTLRRIALGTSEARTGSEPGTSPSTSSSVASSASAVRVRQRSVRVPFQLTCSPL